ncbi:cytochrome P450 [Leptodontidium sp. 2 PMI_412]|nr:cytochrome P450 [Leptodontidium sp. MPI-SDFR-AT-0119]KAH9222117.1 cytochrome P450 [Leptodontidium sp. 2 PMI_412]
MSLSASFDVLLDGYTPSIILGIAAVVLVCWQRLSVKCDPQEPPLLKPSIPYIGHIIGLFRYNGEYFEKLNAKKPLPIATLPMINGKLYIITSPGLIQSAFRNKNLSFDPFMIDFAQKMLALSEEVMVPIRDKPDFIPGMVKEIHSSMLGEHLHKMNKDALNNVALTINGLADTFKPDSLFLWIRETLTMATCNTLLGSHNPLKDDMGLVDALWDFEAGILPLVLGIMPSLVAPKAYKARAAVQAALQKYYAKKYDLEPDVAKLTKARAAFYRQYKISADDIGKLELALLHVSTANAIPTLFWLITFIASDPALVASLREELPSVITVSESKDGKREAHVDITKFDPHCPLLVSCYREVVRLVNSQLGTRRVMADTTISDGKSTYLLRKGWDVNMPSGVSHLSTGSWGPNAASFDARRFMKLDAKGTMSEKAKEEKRAYIPFGGGKHLCPGRNFAFAEILGFVAALLMGFDVKAKDGGLIEVPEIRRAKLGEAVSKPFGKGLAMGANITRRQGWEDVVWQFTT